MQPIWNALQRRDVAKYTALGEKPPPEIMLYPAMVAAVLSPLGMYNVFRSVCILTLIL